MKTQPTQDTFWPKPNSWSNTTMAVREQSTKKKQYNNWKWMVLTLVQINESYSREKPTRVSPYPRRSYADVGRHVQRITNILIQNTKTKTKPFLPSVHVPTSSQVLLGSSKFLLRADVYSESWTQDDKIQTGVETWVMGTKRFHRGNPGKPLMPFTFPWWPINSQ